MVAGPMWQMRARKVLIASRICLPLPVRGFYCMYFDIVPRYMTHVVYIVVFSLSLSSNTLATH